MTEPAGFPDHPWRLSYRTAARRPDGQPVDILHDFYIPALERAVRYDRVAGYFRSSSLAAASQGFSAFVRQGGKARFVVGADLEPDDVAAVLQGDQTRLDERLLDELEGDWPESVRDGVTLLARMVARGHLDLRVALRVHTGTGQPLPFDSLADGYVHPKWALFHDADGRRLYVTGSLNESRTALVRNAENIDVHCDWKSDDSRQRADEAEHGFEALWADRYPGLRVLSLPDAVRARLIRFSEGLSELHEIDGTVEQFPASQLLCDEVGLGKTIEAGLAIRALVLSGRAKRVLIAAPASLTRQWQRELADKFRLDFARALGGQQPRHEYLLPRPTIRTAASLYEPELLIVSTGLLSRPERLRGLPEFDLALVDEAHYARRKNPTAGRRGRAEFGRLYRSIRDHLRPRTRCLLLATATPMQIDPVEVSDLLALIPRVGPFNAGVARDQLILNGLVISGLIRLRQRYGRELFRDEIQAIEAAYSDPNNRRHPVRVNNPPGAIVQRLSNIGLPFHPTVPLPGGDGVVDAPPILIRVVVDHAWQQANEVRQSNLGTEEFLRRAGRQIEELLKS